MRHGLNRPHQESGSVDPFKVMRMIIKTRTRRHSLVGESGHGREHRRRIYGKLQTQLHNRGYRSGFDRPILWIGPSSPQRQQSKTGISPQEAGLEEPYLRKWWCGGPSGEHCIRLQAGRLLSKSSQHCSRPREMFFRIFKVNSDAEGKLRFLTPITFFNSHYQRSAHL